MMFIGVVMWCSILLFCEVVYDYDGVYCKVFMSCSVMV